MDDDTPTATADRAATRPDTPITLPVLHNDHDPTGEVLSLALAVPSATQTTLMGGVVTLDDRSTPADPTDDVLHYSPAAGFIGIDTLTYQVSDPSGHTDTAIVTVHVSATAPRGADLSVRVDRDFRTIAVDVLAEADAPSGEPLYLHGVSQPVSGTVTLDDGRPPGEPSDALLIYTPDPGFSGVEPLTYWVCEDSQRCDTATVTLWVPPVPATGVCLMQLRPRPAPGEERDAEGDIEIETRSPTRPSQPEAGLTTPLAGDRVAGRAVAVAWVADPGAGHVESAAVPVVVANQEPADTLDISESAGTKTEVLPAAQDHAVMSAQGVIVEVPAAALAGVAPSTALHIVALTPTQAPAPLPGIAVSSVREITLTSGQTVAAEPLTLWLPYPDRDQDGTVDGTTPPIAAARLTLWHYDSQHGSWLHLPEAVILPEAKAVRVQTTALGAFVLVQADDGRVGAVGTARAYSAAASAAPLSDAALPSSAPWQTIGTTAAPYVVAWDSTQVPDGDYDLRAICAPDAAALTALERPDTPASGEGQGGSACFISAAYGSPLAPPVQVLRGFRDTYLRPFGIGRWLVSQYGRLSPPLARALRRQSGLRPAIRMALAPLVWGVRGWAYSQRHPGIAALFGLVAIGSLGGGWRWWRRHATAPRSDLSTPILQPSRQALP
ncbi:MAG: hypothetical protein ETSY2_47025 [Candidatus Entotheonella gemina]|uniref:Cadherin-like domain-containing protein n=1 Tax=Candidatus Entotheonella gemina TaxID=1429439 RepID=W4LFJ0_9BACT|nr:MAG: hypothetical protein ETSY2_47025 [Candidatus Entotheonella gemina]